MNVKKLITPKVTVISLIGKVDEDMIKALGEGMAKAWEKGKELVILLSSHGGMVDAGDSIAQRLLLGLKAGMDIKIIGVTYVSSAAVRILTCLPYDRRFITADCSIMIHPTKRVGGKGDSMVSLTEANERTHEELAHIEHATMIERENIKKLLRIMKIGKREFMELYRTSHRFDAKSALKHNLACDIVR